MLGGFNEEKAICSSLNKKYKFKQIKKLIDMLNNKKTDFH